MRMGAQYSDDVIPCKEPSAVAVSLQTAGATTPAAASSARTRYHAPPPRKAEPPRAR